MSSTPVSDPLSAEETILVVDDEHSVRHTFVEWLKGAQLGATVLAAHDAPTALDLAREHVIDLAILDWNLGGGDTGLDLLSDLYIFNPDVVAIMITAYANEATPLDAMRKGVRDYLDKNHDLKKDVFLGAVKRQLEVIRPARRARRLHLSLVAFREAVEKILPLVQASTTLHDPVTLPGAIRGLFQFLLTTTRAQTGVLLVRSVSHGKETLRIYTADGTALTTPIIPFSRTIAASALSMQEPCRMTNLGQAAAGHVELQPFEQDRFSLLATPLALTPDVNVVLELFDKQTSEGKIDREGFSKEDYRLVRDAGTFGADLLRQALVQRQTYQLLFDAIGAALQASEQVAQSLEGTAQQRLEQPPPEAVLDRLRQSLTDTGETGLDAGDSVRLVEAIRVLALRHGQPALRHCLDLVEGVRRLLDRIVGEPNEG